MDTATAALCPQVRRQLGRKATRDPKNGHGCLQHPLAPCSAWGGMQTKAVFPSYSSSLGTTGGLQPEDSLHGVDPRAESGGTSAQVLRTGDTQQCFHSSRNAIAQWNENDAIPQC